MLRGLALPVDPRVVVGLTPADDAAVVRLTDDLALVVTTDFFSPLVDDPFDFGRIAAANALSDVYAMGGTPLVALNIVAFPSRTVGLEVLSEVLRGGAEIAREAGIAIVGGHSVEDPEPKYGLAVVGTVHPNKIWTKGGALPGDALVITKPLGTGVLSTALKRERLTESDAVIRAAVRSMTSLNARARTTLERVATPHAVTDVTGYGLIGHLHEMLAASERVAATVHASVLPILDGALELAREGVLAGGTRANRVHFSDVLSVAANVDDALAWMACDAQTSGGLLVALSPSDAKCFVQALVAEGITAAHIGEITEAASPMISLVS